MRLITLFPLLLVAVYSQCYTKKCKQYWNSQGNGNNQFFYPQTYGGDIHPNPLQFSTNRQFRVIVQKNVGYCSGKYCVNGQFTCQSNGNTNCYHVEHIVDENGPDFGSCSRCKDIPGNMIMAAGDWNMALGGLARKSYSQSQAEKTMIYGANVMQRAKYYIQQCCDNLIANGQSTNIDCENNEEDCNCDANSICGCDCSSDIIENGPVIDTSTQSTVGLTATILVIIILIGIAVIYYFYRNKKLNDAEKIRTAIDGNTSDLDSIKA